MKNIGIFKEVYVKNLKKIRINKPDYYLWPLSELTVITERMLNAIDSNNFNKDSLAFKHTCKELNIKHTYKAIKNYIKEN
jgi:hypothetical protein